MGRFSASLCTCMAQPDLRKASFAGIYQLSLYVGYAQSGLTAGFTMSSAQFLAIGSEAGTELQSIKPTGDETSDTVSIQTLDSAGRAVDTYTWCDWAGPDSDQEAWSDGSGDIIEGVSFAPGQGLWVYGASAEQGLMTSGKVGKEDVQVTLCNGFVAVGNPFPVAIDLQDIVPVGEGTSDMVSIQTLDSAGRAVDTYTWCDWAGPDSDQEAWSDGSGDIIEGVSFAPGQGLWVYGASAEQSIRFPAPEL